MTDRWLSIRSDNAGVRIAQHPPPQSEFQAVRPQASSGSAPSDRRSWSSRCGASIGDPIRPISTPGSADFINAWTLPAPSSVAPALIVMPLPLDAATSPKPWPSMPIGPVIVNVVVGRIVDLTFGGA